MINLDEGWICYQSVMGEGFTHIQIYADMCKPLKGNVRSANDHHASRASGELTLLLSHLKGIWALAVFIVVVHLLVISYSHFFMDCGTCQDVHPP